MSALRPWQRRLAEAAVHRVHVPHLGMFLDPIGTMLLTLPFVVAAFFIKPFLQFAGRFRQHLGKVEKVMGVLMILFAILLVTNRVNEIANWMLETFPAFTNI